MKAFENIDQVFCDDYESLNKIIKKGLKKDIKIYSSSPYIVNKNYLKTIYIPELNEKFDMKKFISELNFLINSIYLKIYEDKDLSPYTINICRKLLHSHRIIYQATMIKNIELSKKTLVVIIKTGDKDYDDLLNAYWKYFIPKDRLVIKIFDKEKNKINQKFLKRKLTIFKIKYRIIRILSKLIPNKFYKKNILVFGNNELMFQTMYRLFFKGFKIQHSNHILKDVHKDGILKENLEKIFDNKIEEEIKSFIKRWVSIKHVEICYQLVKKEILKKIILKNNYENLFENYFIKNCNKKTFVACNFPRSPEHLAIKRILNKYKSKLISFQHGVTREISEISDFYSILDETLIADIVFSYNNHYKKITSSTLFNKGKTITVGNTYYHNKIKKNYQFKKIKILFVSMCMLKGNSRNYFTKEINDINLIKNEIFLLKNFNNINYQVVYKKYDVKFERFLDPDLIKNELSNLKNITPYANSEDIKNFAHKFDFIILQGASSTLTYCLSLNIPIIYLYNNKLNVLRKPVLELMKKSVFFFDQNHKEFGNQILNFFNKDLKNIDDEWNNKKILRDSLIYKYFYLDNVSPDKIAANYINNL